MEFNFKEFISSSELLPAIFGMLFSIVISSLSTLIITMKKKRAIVKSLSKYEIGIILDNPDAQKIFRYLKIRLGDVEISSYANDEDIKNKVNKCLARITEFQNSSKELQIDNPPPSNLIIDNDRNAPNATSKDLIEKEHSLISKARVQIKNGQTWNALAQLRRDLEKRLYKKYGLNSNSTARPTRISNLLPTAIRPLYRLTFHPLNMAVHGEVLSDFDIESTLSNANKLMCEIEAQND